MASTNKTTNYNLSQFIGADKPAWLADYNQDMSKIDTQMKANADSATSADGKADANTTKIGDLTYLSTTAKNNLVSAINEVDGNTDTAQNTANSAATSATTAVTEINNLKNYLNLNTFHSYQYNSADITKTNVTTTDGVIYVASNTQGTLCKVYGRIKGACTTAWNEGKITINVDTGLRPTEDITIYSIGFWLSGANLQYSNPVKGVLKTDGKIELVFYNTAQNDNFDIYLPPCLYFVKNFGDQ